MITNGLIYSPGVATGLCGKDLLDFLATIGLAQVADIQVCWDMPDNDMGPPQAPGTLHATVPKATGGIDALATAILDAPCPNAGLIDQMHSKGPFDMLRNCGLLDFAQRVEKIIAWRDRHTAYSDMRRALMPKQGEKDKSISLRLECGKDRPYALSYKPQVWTTHWGRNYLALYALQTLTPAINNDANTCKQWEGWQYPLTGSTDPEHMQPKSLLDTVIKWHLEPGWLGAVALDDLVSSSDPPQNSRCFESKVRLRERYFHLSVAYPWTHYGSSDMQL